jgi:hypothetical protein
MRGTWTPTAGGGARDTVRLWPIAPLRLLARSLCGSSSPARRGWCPSHRTARACASLCVASPWCCHRALRPAWCCPTLGTAGAPDAAAAMPRPTASRSPPRSLGLRGGPQSSSGPTTWNICRRPCGLRRLCWWLWDLVWDLAVCPPHSAVDSRVSTSRRESEMRCAVWQARGLAAGSGVRWGWSKIFLPPGPVLHTIPLDQSARVPSPTQARRRRAPLRWESRHALGRTLTWCAQERRARADGGHWRAALARDDQLHHRLVPCDGQGKAALPWRDHHLHSHPKGTSNRTRPYNYCSMSAHSLCLPEHSGIDQPPAMNLFRFAGGQPHRISRTCPPVLYAATAR